MKPKEPDDPGEAEAHDMTNGVAFVRTPILFSLLGALSGAITLLMLSSIKGSLYFAGFPFAVGLFVGIRFLLRSLLEQVPRKRFVQSFLTVALGFPVLIWALAGVSGAVQFLLVSLSPKDTRTPLLLVGYWAGLFCSAVLAALLLWISIRVLGLNAKRNVLWQLILASVVVSAAAVGMDWLIVGHYEYALHSEIRKWANFGVLFLAGNTLMSFLYGFTIRNELVGKGRC